MTYAEQLAELDEKRKQIEKDIAKLKEKIEYEELHSLGEPISRYDLLDAIDKFDNPHDIHRYIILQTVRKIIKTMPCIGEGEEE